MAELEKIYLEYAEMISNVTNLERELHNKKRVIDDMKKDLSAPDSDGGFGVELSAHAFKQISERLEVLAMESPVIHKDVFKPDSPEDSLLLPSNLKCFIITLLANARSKNQYNKEDSRNGGIECRFTVDIKKWSEEKTLQFVGIIQNNNIKTGFFNWV